MATERKLPSAVTSRARKAATKLEQPRQQFPQDREWIVKIQLQEWYDNGEPLQDARFTGSAESVYNQAMQSGWRDIPTLNIVPADSPGNFTLYASRTS